MAWEAADNLTICGVEYTVSMVPVGTTHPGPVLTLTEVVGTGGGQVIALFAHCWGHGWAEFHGPGLSEAICTDPVVEDCPGKNNFTIRIQCICNSSVGWAGPGWYFGISSGLAHEYLTSPGCEVLVCPGGPYATQAAAEAAACFTSLGCAPQPEVVVPNVIEIEFYDTTGACVCLEGLVLTLPFNSLIGGSAFFLVLPAGDELDGCDPDITDYNVSIACGYGPQVAINTSTDLLFRFLPTGAEWTGSGGGGTLEIIATAIDNEGTAGAGTASFTIRSGY